MLPKLLRNAITNNYLAHNLRTYAKNVGEADKIWQDAGLWKPGVPMSTRADKGVESIKQALEKQ